MILGAFGCGAFCNPPEIVAGAFKTAQARYASHFETIEYAIFYRGKEVRNFDIFCQTLGVRPKYSMNRFLRAHESDYELALSEIRKGRKSSCWMWYIFPQIAGLGQSRASRLYAITCLDEARDYLEDPILGAHTKELCQALLETKTNDAGILLGWPDNMKLKSCMTLFEQANPEEELFAKVLDKFFGGQRDENTLRILETLQ